MQIDYPHLLAHLGQLDKQELLRYLEKMIVETMSYAQVDDVLGDVIYRLQFESLDPAATLAALRQFRTDSFAGKYYAPFEIDSRNFTYIPPETDAWFREIGYWLDRACQLAEDGQPELGRQVYEICRELIDNISEGIVFADEAGEWMITSAYDYEKIFGGE